MTEPSRFVAPESRFLSPCASCARKHANSSSCDAFPAGIPRLILLGRHAHRTPYPGDHGLQYVADPARPL